MSQKRKSTKYPPTEGETEDTAVIAEPTTAAQKRTRTTLPRGSKSTTSEITNDDLVLPDVDADIDVVDITDPTSAVDTATVILPDAVPTVATLENADDGKTNVDPPDSVPPVTKKKSEPSKLDIPPHLNPSNPAHFDHFLFYLLVVRAESDAPPAQNICKEEYPMLYAWLQNLKKEYKLYASQTPNCHLSAQQILVLESLHVPLTSRGDDHWNRYYELLVQYRNRHGHILVPRLCEVPGLGDWVTDQRRQYKAKQQGQTSQMSITRQELLEELEFVWHVRNRPEWEVRFSELLEYKEAHGDCRVPQHYKPNKSLGKWVAKQREQFKLKLKGQHSFLTPYREEKLNQVGFSWHVRNSLDGEVQAVMDGLVNNAAAAAAAATTTDTTINDADGEQHTAAIDANDLMLPVVDLEPIQLDTAAAVVDTTPITITDVKQELQHEAEQEQPTLLLNNPTNDVEMTTQIVEDNDDTTRVEV